MQPRIYPACAYQLFMRSLFGLDSVLDRNDAVCILNGGKAMGDDQLGASLHHPLDSLLNHLLRSAVDARGRLIQHEYLRIEGDCPGE